MKKVLTLAVILAAVMTASCAVMETQAGDSGMAFKPAAYTSGQPAVQLLSAKVKMLGIVTSTYYCRFAGDIELENIAYAKEVKVVYNIGKGWVEAPAFFVKSLGNNREHWEFSIDLGSYSQSGDFRSGYTGTPVTVQFAVKYKVNGVTYWDNNGGYNVDYRITTAEGSGTKPYAPAALGKNKVCLNYSTYSDYPTTYFRGTLTAKAMPGTTSVSIIYTTNSWKQTMVLNAYRIYSINGSDVYAFEDYRVNYNANPTYEFAIAYNAGGTTYWDNNVNVNYFVSSSQTSPEY